MKNRGTIADQYGPKGKKKKLRNHVHVHGIRPEKRHRVGDRGRQRAQLIREMLEEGSDHAKCELVTGTFATLLQVALGLTGLAVLIAKRSRERPRRTFLVWSFDASKQVVSGLLQHGINILFGILFAQHSVASACSWYLVNFTIAVFCGILILWLFVMVYRWAVERYHLTLLRSGEYGNPPSWRPWLAQLALWSILSCVEKAITASAVILPLKPLLDQFAAWIEQPPIGHPKLELTIVMVLAPALLNTLFFYAVDNLIMRRGHGLRFRRHHAGDVSSATSTSAAECNTEDPMLRHRNHELSAAFLDSPESS